MKPLLKSVRTQSHYTGFHLADAEAFACSIRSQGGRAEIIEATSCAAGGTEHWGYSVRYQSVKALERAARKREVLAIARIEGRL